MFVSSFVALTSKTVVVEPDDHESHVKASNAVYINNNSYK